MSGNPDQNKTLANSLVRGLLVLESFNPREDRFTLAELVKRLKIPKSSLHRVVKTLSAMNYLRYDEQSKRYHLGTRVLSLLVLIHHRRDRQPFSP